MRCEGTFNGMLMALLAPQRQPMGPQRHCRVAPNEDKALSHSPPPSVPKTLLQGPEEAIGFPSAPKSDTMSLPSLQIRALETSHARGTSPSFGGCVGLGSQNDSFFSVSQAQFRAPLSPSVSPSAPPHTYTFALSLPCSKSSDTSTSVHVTEFINTGWVCPSHYIVLPEEQDSFFCTLAHSTAPSTQEVFSNC